MHAGKNMGIMTSQKKPTAESMRPVGVNGAPHSLSILILPILLKNDILSP